MTSYKEILLISTLQGLKVKYWFLYLNLLHSEVQEGVLVADTDQALGALTSHAGAQASI